MELTAAVQRGQIEMMHAVRADLIARSDQRAQVTVRYVIAQTDRAGIDEKSCARAITVEQRFDDGRRIGIPVVERQRGHALRTFVACKSFDELAGRDRSDAMFGKIAQLFFERGSRSA